MPRIVEPPAAAIDWHQRSSDVKRNGRCTKPIHIRESFGIRSQSTVQAIWQGKPVGLIPFLKVSKACKLNPFIYLMER